MHTITLLRPGTRIEVRSRYNGVWCRGFEVAGVAESHYLVRRLSDNTVLPADFDLHEVRPAA